jgi:hypothetical protein
MMEKISLLLLVVKKTLIGTAIVSLLGFCGLSNFFDTCINEKDNQVEKSIKQGPTDGRDQMPRSYKQGPTDGRDQMPRAYKQGPTDGRDQMPRA